MATSAVANHNHNHNHNHHHQQHPQHPQHHHPFARLHDRSRASSTKFSLVSSSLESTSTSQSTAAAEAAKGKLYRQITPRKKIDRFGVDKTDYKAYFLSSTVFPTAVRATLLAEMQEVNPHKCGFDIVERRLGGSHNTPGGRGEDNGDSRSTHNTATACTTRSQSAVNAPPPTAVQSQTDRSFQSAPVVAINFLEASNASAAGSSDNNKDRRASSSGHSHDKNNNNNNNNNNANASSRDKTNSKNALANDKSVFSLPNGTEAGNILEAEDENDVCAGVPLPGESEKDRDLDLENKVLDENARAQIERIKRRLEAEKQQRRKKPKSRAVPRLTAYSSAETARLINYQWMSRETRLSLEREDGGDIRDPLYLNTFFPDERPVRFHKTTLPTVRRSSHQRSRPWTVTEKTVQARAATAAQQSSLGKPGAKSAGTYKSYGLPATGGPRAAHALPTAAAARRSGGWTAPARRSSNNNNNNMAADGAGRGGGGGGGDENDYDDDWDDCDDFYDENEREGTAVRRRRQRRGPLLEVRPFLTGSGGAEGGGGGESGIPAALGDQRSKLRGKDGCLHSRVKQCVRFVRYRERLDKQGDDRPLKAEPGRYRPMSNTDVSEHRPPNPPPSPEQKMQRSVDAYRKYVDNIAMQTKFVAGKSAPGKYQTPTGIKAGGLVPTSSRLQTRNGAGGVGGNHLVSSASLDPDSAVVRFVMDSNLPDNMAAQSSSALSPATPGRLVTTAAIYTKDSADVGQVLAIRRISPKVSSNRIVAGTRGVVKQDQSGDGSKSEETPRWATVDSDDGEDMGEATPTNAIVVPMATKSECLSEYSGVVDREERT